MSARKREFSRWTCVFFSEGGPTRRGSTYEFAIRPGLRDMSVWEEGRGVSGGFRKETA
jgi:hypothetical protein